MKRIPDTTQGRITLSLITALVLAVALCFTGIDDSGQDGGVLLRLFLLFAASIVVGVIIAIQVIPGLITIDGMMKSITTLSRKKDRKAARQKNGNVDHS